MVEGLAEDFWAKLLPVALGVQQMQVPSFVNGFGRGDAMASSHGEEGEFFVFVDDSLGVDRGPSVFLSESI